MMGTQQAVRRSTMFVAVAALLLALMPTGSASAHGPIYAAVEATGPAVGHPGCASGPLTFTGTATGSHAGDPIVAAPLSATFHCDLTALVVGGFEGEMIIDGDACNFQGVYVAGRLDVIFLTNCEGSGRLLLATTPLGTTYTGDLVITRS